jgi:ABC-type amino acid transport substrate-binding protein
MMTGIGLFGWLIGEFSAVTTVSKFHHSIESYADLRGKKVATVKATTSVLALEKFGAKITETDDLQSACNLLTAGSVRAVVYDSPALRYYIKDNSSDAFTLTGEDFNQQFYGFAFPQGSPLREVVNRELLSLRENQQQIVDYSSISRRWFGSD